MQRLTRGVTRSVNGTCSNEEGELNRESVSHFSIDARSLNGYGGSGSLPVRVRHMKNEAHVKDQSAKSRHIRRAAVTVIAPLCGHL